MYSNPPLHGARIAAAIMSDKESFRQWQMGAGEDVSAYSEDEDSIETSVEQEWGTWELGSYRESDCNGRVSMTGLTEGPVDYVADAILEEFVEYETWRSLS
ncbi:aspartate aminotransferase [Gracilaria domingensis]|nr:aspartate aminotransferase [Gracilaria domingensis]